MNTMFCSEPRLRLPRCSPMRVSLPRTNITRLIVFAKSKGGAAKSLVQKASPPTSKAEGKETRKQTKNTQKLHGGVEKQSQSAQKHSQQAKAGGVKRGSTAAKAQVRIRASTISFKTAQCS